ncbi:BNR-4 repeat-containing protein [Neiella sp. HB171785]|uniref:BNR-4 repeat-containing protein n=2 Tax=Neiella litorisoli TaxID=2771431 RepID=A0A8J6QN87_9GAMM|nr:BNR-4 repeat-containing protein [Neiella litorisoli]
MFGVASANAAVTLEQQIKITDEGLYFNGFNHDYGTVSNPDTSADTYDYFFGPQISAHGDSVKTYKHYVFTTWYKGGKDNRHVMLSRLNTQTGVVKHIEFPHQHTGFRGDPLVGESHNTIGLAVSPIDGTIHMVYDMHGYNDTNHGGKFKDDYFRYSYSVPGTAEVSDSQFTLSKFVKDTSSVSQGSDDYKHLTMTGSLADKSNFASLTYPTFFTNTDGTLLLYMRSGGNNNGGYVFNKYDASTKKWSKFTKFNVVSAKNYGNAYNWGLYGHMKYVNGKLRVGFQQRSSDNNDRFKYQNGLYYAYSDHPEGFGSWKNHQGQSMTFPLVNSDEIKFYEPGDLISHTEANSVYISGYFDWTVTAKGDLHMISAARSSDRNRADYQEVYLHSYKPAGASDFIHSTDFAGATNIYTSGDNIYIIGLDNGQPYVEKAAGGTNDFTRVYQADDDLVFKHGRVHIANGKLYYYLQEKGTTTTQPLYLQIIDLDLDGAGNQPVVSFPQSSMTVEEGYQQLSFKVAASSPVAGRTISKVDLYVDDNFIRTDSADPFVWGHNSKPTELLGLAAGTHTFKAVATDSEGVTGESTMTLEVTATKPTVAFPQSSMTVDEGYEKLAITLDAATPVAGRTIESVTLFINGEEVRTDTSLPYLFGHSSKPHETGAMGWEESHGINPNPLTAGTHIFKAVVVDSAGAQGEAQMTLTVVGSSVPTVNFVESDIELTEGYESLSVTADVTTPESVDVVSVALYINDTLIREEYEAPYTWGLGAFTHELLGLTVGSHTFKAVVMDSNNNTSETTMMVDVAAQTGASCTATQNISWDTRTEVELASGNCISFASDLAGEVLQAWDSDDNTSCDFRGEIISTTNPAVSAVVTSNYQSFTGLSGTNFKLVPTNGCQYIKVRAY